MKVKAILAVAALLVIGVCLIMLLFSAITGSISYLLAALFCLIVIPPIIYGYIIVLRYIKDKNRDQK